MGLLDPHKFLIRLMSTSELVRMGVLLAALCGWVWLYHSHCSLRFGSKDRVQRRDTEREEVPDDC